MGAGAGLPRRDEDAGPDGEPREGRHLVRGKLEFRARPPHHVAHAPEHAEAQ